MGARPWELSRVWGGGLGLASRGPRPSMHAAGVRMHDLCTGQRYYRREAVVKEVAGSRNINT